MSSPRVARRADVAYRLAHPAGAASGDTQEKTRLFELPQEWDGTDGWTGLLNRIFYDANAFIRSREPDDTNFPVPSDPVACPSDTAPPPHCGSAPCPRRTSTRGCGGRPR